MLPFIDIIRDLLGPRRLRATVFGMPAVAFEAAAPNGAFVIKSLQTI
jgi:hypothetical protein